MLLREVRRGFSEESQFHFQVADTTLQFLYPFRFRHSGWKRIPCYSLPVCFNPEPESGIIDTELAGDLGDRQGVIDHLLGGLFLKSRTVPFRFPRHFPVPFRVRSYWIPVRKPGGTSLTSCTDKRWYRGAARDYRVLRGTPVALRLLLHCGKPVRCPPHRDEPRGP